MKNFAQVLYDRYMITMDKLMSMALSCKIDAEKKFSINIKH